MLLFSDLSWLRTPLSSNQARTHQRSGQERVAGILNGVTRKQFYQTEERPLHIHTAHQLLQRLFDKSVFATSTSDTSVVHVCVHIFK